MYWTKQMSQTSRWQDRMYWWLWKLVMLEKVKFWTFLASRLNKTKPVQRFDCGHFNINKKERHSRDWGAEWWKLLLWWVKPNIYQLFPDDCASLIWKINADVELSTFRAFLCVVFFVWLPPACPLKPSKLRLVELQRFPYGSIFANFTSHSRPPARADDSSFEADPPMPHADTQLVLEQQYSHRSNDSEQTPFALPSLSLSLFLSLPPLLISSPQTHFFFKLHVSKWRRLRVITVGERLKRWQFWGM